ncbi:YceI family protein [Pseudonocardia nigra]|uniref:YceI family protein n=1 Tax=Pseudonocardia nigra TaxID=1921578 RepID=UPI001C5DE8F5|nr:YceI family protein [Pseudonocardia nigra]
MTRNVAIDVPADPAAAELAPGWWTVDPARTRLLLDTQVLGAVAVRARFPRVSGAVEVTAGPPAGPVAVAVDVAVETASLTSGSPRLDALLGASGLVDPAAGPLIRYRARRLPIGAPRTVDGSLATARGERPVRLTVVDAGMAATGFRLHLRGVVDRETVAGLLARPGAARLIGPRSRLDLTVALAPTAACG